MANNAPLTQTQALLKLQKYCVYQDRCHQEVRNKLLQLKIYGEELENVITELIADKFLDEERFAKSYARGKFNLKKWGRNRIRMELRRRGISDYCMKKAMLEIEEEDYDRTLEEMLAKKEPLVKGKNAFERVQKLVNYAIGRGYEAELVWTKAKLLIPLD